MFVPLIINNQKTNYLISDNGEIKNLGNMIGKIIINEFPQYVIT